MNEEILKLKTFIEQQDRRITELERGIYNFSEKQEWTKKLKVPVLIADGDGLKIGQSATEKVAFYGDIPVIQQQFPNAPSTPSGIYVQAEAQSTVNSVNALITVLRNIGITN